MPRSTAQDKTAWDDWGDPYDLEWSTTDLDRAARALKRGARLGIWGPASPGIAWVPDEPEGSRDSTAAYKAWLSSQKETSLASFWFWRSRATGQTLLLVHPEC